MRAHPYEHSLACQRHPMVIEFAGFSFVRARSLAPTCRSFIDDLHALVLNYCSMLPLCLLFTYQQDPFFSDMLKKKKTSINSRVRGKKSEYVTHAWCFLIPFVSPFVLSLQRRIFLPTMMTMMIITTIMAASSSLTHVKSFSIRRSFSRGI